jgi:hypothetical protein
LTKEEIRLAESCTRKKHWKRWGPYLSERAWGTVREDYSAHGNAWEYLPHNAEIPKTLRLEIRPLIAFRDYHGTTHENSGINLGVQ